MCSALRICFVAIEFNQVNASPSSVSLMNSYVLFKECLSSQLTKGASGCGKSTIIQLLERFYDIDDGRLVSISFVLNLPAWAVLNRQLVDGVDIRQLGVQHMRSHFGLVSQEPILFDLTISENITYGLENISFESMVDAAKKANIHDYIRNLPEVSQ